MTYAQQLKAKVEGWKRQAKSNERRWMLAKDLEWIIATTTTEAELVERVETLIHMERFSR